MRITFVRKVGKIGKGVLEGLKTVFKIKRIGAFLLHTFLLWSVFDNGLVCPLFSCTNIKTNIARCLICPDCRQLWNGSTSSGRNRCDHGIIALALSIYAVSWNDAMAFAILSHGSQAIGIILLGLVSVIILFIKRHKVKIPEKTL